MKKCGLIFVTLLMILAFASIGFAATITPGLELGLNISNISSADSAGNSVDDGSKSKIGFCGGATIDLGFSEMFSLVSGLGYTVKGAKMDEMGTELFFNLSYLDIPVLAKIKMNAGNAIPYLVVGPTFGILMNAEVTDNTISVDMKNEISAMNIGLKMGVGADVPVGNMIFFVGAGYELGLSNIDKNTVGDSSAKIRNIPIGAGVRFNLK